MQHSGLFFEPWSAENSYKRNRTCVACAWLIIECSQRESILLGFNSNTSQNQRPKDGSCHFGIEVFNNKDRSVFFTVQIHIHWTGTKKWRVPVTARHTNKWCRYLYQVEPLKQWRKGINNCGGSMPKKTTAHVVPFYYHDMCW